MSVAKLMSSARVKSTERERDSDQRLAELFRQEAAFVWRVLRRLGLADADAEDAVQEVFLVVAKRLDMYEERGAVRAWLVAIARQVAQHAQRSRFRHERKLHALPDADFATSDDPQRVLESAEAAAIVREFLAALDRDHALTFYLAEVEDMTVPEIAASLDVNVNTIYGRLRSARRRFEKHVRVRTSRP